MPSYHILTFGCQMNVNDSFWLGRVLESRGFTKSSLKEADVVCIATCSVREKPEQKVVATLHRIRSECVRDPLVCITGCVAQQLGETLFSYSKQVRLVAGTDGLAQLPGAIEMLLEDEERKMSFLDFSTHYIEREEPREGRVPANAYVNIMQGCDNYCTYCIVPYTRGRQKSRKKEAILEECREKLACGAREITLLGQNVNAFGLDSAGDHTPFYELLAALDELPGLERLRYTSPHPKDMGEKDIASFAHLKHLCPQLHLPLQSGSDRILKRMGRGYTAQVYFDLVCALKEACNDIALSTDLIVGFPGENEEDLEETLSLMEKCHFISSFSFCYSDRPGTRANTFLDKIPSPLQHARLNRVQALQEELTSQWLAKRAGQKTTLLIEHISKRQADQGSSWQGRDPYGTIVHVSLPNTHDYTGKMLAVTITQAAKHCLHATAEGEAW